MTSSQKNKLKAGALSFAIASFFVGGFLFPSIGCMGDGFNIWIMAGLGCWLALAFIVVCFRDYVDAIFKNGGGRLNQP